MQLKVKEQKNHQNSFNFSHSRLPAGVQILSLVDLLFLNEWMKAAWQNPAAGFGNLPRFVIKQKAWAPDTNRSHITLLQRAQKLSK